MTTQRNEKPIVSATLFRSLALVFAWQVSAGIAAAQTDGAEAPQVPAGIAATSASAAVAEARETLGAAFQSSDLPVRIEAMRASLGLTDEWLGELALPLLEAPNLTEWVLAFQVVATTNPRVAKRELVNALRSGERTIRLRALLGLGALGDSDTVPNIVAILKEDPDPDVRAAAARALGAIGDTLGSLPLLQAVDSQYPPVREQAVLALLKIGDGDLVPFLTRQLEERGEGGQVNIIRLLALIPDPALVPAIRPYLESGNNELRCEAAGAILKITKESGSNQP